MALKRTHLSEPGTTVRTGENSCQPFEVVHDKRVTVENTDCQHVLDFDRRVSWEVPNHLFRFVSFKFIDEDPEPIPKSFPYTEMLFNLIQFVKNVLP